MSVLIPKAESKCMDLPMEEIAGQYEAGMSSTILSQKYHASVTTIIRRLRNHGVTIRSSKDYARKKDLPMATIADLYESGWSTGKLAQKYHVTKATINTRLRRHGVQIRRNINEVHIPEEKLRQLCSDGVYQKDIAKHFGVSSNTIRRHLNKHGLRAQGLPQLKEVISENLADPIYAPLWGVKIGCDRCKNIKECQRRQSQDLWPLCCIPTRLEVALAYRDGRIGHDDNMPEWLPELVKELTHGQT